MGPANAFFLYPSSFPFLLPQSLWGRKSVALGGDSACNQRAGKSLSFGLNTSLSLSPSASALARLKSYCLYGRDFRKGAHRSPPNPPCFVCSFFVSCSPIGWDWQERALSRDHSHPRSRPKHKTCFPLTPTSFRWPPTWQRVQYQQHHWHFFVGHIESNISKCAIFPKLLALGQVFLKWILGQGPVFPLWILIKPLVTAQCGQNQNHNVSSPHGEAQTLLLNCQDPVS